MLQHRELISVRRRTVSRNRMKATSEFTNITYKTHSTEFKGSTMVNYSCKCFSNNMKSAMAMVRCGKRSLIRPFSLCIPVYLLYCDVTAPRALDGTPKGVLSGFGKVVTCYRCRPPVVCDCRG